MSQPTRYTFTADFANSSLSQATTSQPTQLTFIADAAATKALREEIESLVSEAFEKRKVPRFTVVTKPYRFENGSVIITATTGKSSKSVREIAPSACEEFRAAGQHIDVCVVPTWYAAVGVKNRSRAGETTNIAGVTLKLVSVAPATPSGAAQVDQPW
jgi:hypothetical protein